MSRAALAAGIHALRLVGAPSGALASKPPRLALSRADALAVKRWAAGLRHGHGAPSGTARYDGRLVVTTRRTIDGSGREQGSRRAVSGVVVGKTYYNESPGNH